MTKAVSLAPDRTDHVLAIASTALLSVVLVAIGRGHADWARVSPIIWAHITTILVALVLTPVMLTRRRGDTLHRTLGWVWVCALALTAALSFGIREIFNGHFSYIHILSAWTLIQVPIIVMTARKHDHRGHRRAVRGMVIGALLVAGLFTFGFRRLLSMWLFA